MHKPTRNMPGIQLGRRLLVAVHTSAPIRRSRTEKGARRQSWLSRRYWNSKTVTLSSFTDLPSLPGKKQILTFLIIPLQSVGHTMPSDHAVERNSNAKQGLVLFNALHHIHFDFVSKYCRSLKQGREWCTHLQNPIDHHPTLALCSIYAA